MGPDVAQPPPHPRGPAGGLRLGSGQAGGRGEQERHRGERDGVGEQRRTRPGGGHDHAREDRSGRRGGREPDVEQRVSLPKEAARRQHRSRRGPGQRATAGGERARERRQRDHGQQGEVRGQQRQARERRRLHEAQGGQADTAVKRLQAGDQWRRRQRRRELKPQEQPRGRQRASRLVEDQHRQRDLSQPIAQFVDEADQGQPAESGQAKRAKCGAHGAPTLEPRTDR